MGPGGAATITPTSMVWSRVDGVGGVSPARYGHSAACVQLKSSAVATVVFGGVLAGERDNSVLVYDHGAWPHPMRCATTFYWWPVACPIACCPITCCPPPHMRLSNYGAC